MTYRLFISGEAYRSLSNQVLFLARINPQAARKLKEKLMKAIHSLEQSPLRFRSLDEADPYCPYRLLFVPDWYGIIYMVQGNEVFVEYVLDMRQDYQWLINKYLKNE